MPRPPRLNIADIPQHVVQRGNNRQPCFFAASDYRLYLSLLAIYCRRHRCQIHAYVLMTNHVHLLVTPDIPDGVSLLIRDAGRDFVRNINKKYERTGTLWESRFKSSVIDSDEYCLACYRYIELNPVRAKMVSHPRDYQWSSYRANAIDGESPIVTPHDLWIQLGQNVEERRQTYRTLFESELDSDALAAIRRGLAKGLPTGTPDFTRKIESVLGYSLVPRRPGRPKSVPG